MKNNNSTYSTVMPDNPFVFLLVGVATFATPTTETSAMEYGKIPGTSLSNTVSYALPSESITMTDEEKMQTLASFASQLHSKSRDLEPEVAELLERDFMSLI